MKVANEKELEHYVKMKILSVVLRFRVTLVFHFQ